MLRAENRNFMGILKRLGIFALIIFIFGVCFRPVFAQNFSFKNHPVLNANTDANGVDIASGSYILRSPFVFKTPGTSRLNMQTLFNGRKITFNLNIYLVDDTYTWIYGDPNERHLKIHLGGVEKLFTCYNAGLCTPVMVNDGSSLTRETTNRYVYRDGDGSIYTFFDITTRLLAGNDECNNDLSTCNIAVYSAVAHVSTIQYPNGERLTYQPFTTAQTINGVCSAADTITSNLGFKLTISSPAACNFTSSVSIAGQNWLSYQGIGLDNDTVSLHKGSVILSSVANTMTYSNSFRDLQFRQQDHLGRVYLVNLHADPQSSCGKNAQYGDNQPDYSMLNPIFVMSPGGVQTDIVYHSLYVTVGYPMDFAAVPVKTLTRGGRTWSYDLRYSGKTATNPMGGTRSVVTAAYSDGYNYGNLTLSGHCLIGLIGERVTSEVDELGRETRYEYDGSFPTKVTLPEGDGMRYTYDARHNLTSVVQFPKPGSGLPERTLKQINYDSNCSSPKKCNQPNWSRDANGNQTDYTYSDSHGGVLTATAAADVNGIRQKVFYTYESYNTGDGIIYRLNRVESCGLTSGQIAFTSCPALVTTSVNTMSYLGNTFLPVTNTLTDGAASLAATTSYTYNDSGNPITIDGPRTDIDDRSYTTYDAAQRVIFEISADPDAGGPLKRKIIKHTYNADNKELRIDVGTGANTDGSDFVIASYKRHTYDSAGLLVRTVAGQP